MLNNNKIQKAKNVQNQIQAENVLIYNDFSGLGKEYFLKKISEIQNDLYSDNVIECSDIENELCYLSVSSEKEKYLIDLLNPIMKKNGFSLITVDMTSFDEENKCKKLDEILSIVNIAIFDMSSDDNFFDLGYLHGNCIFSVILFDKQHDFEELDFLNNFTNLSYDKNGDNSNFEEELNYVLIDFKNRKKEILNQNNYIRLIQNNKYEDAIDAAIKYLDSFLSRIYYDGKSIPLNYILKELHAKNEEDLETIICVKDWIINKKYLTLLKNYPINNEIAYMYISKIEKLCAAIQNGDIYKNI